MKTKEEIKDEIVELYGATQALSEAMDILHAKRMEDRNKTLEEVAQEFDKMTSLGDTAASFAVYVRNMKK